MCVWTYFNCTCCNWTIFFVLEKVFIFVIYSHFSSVTNGHELHLLSAGFMTRCLSLDGLFQWAAVLTVVDTTITPTLLYVDVTVLSLWTSTSLGALQLLRHYCTVFFSSKRRSTGGRISFTGGPSEAYFCCCSLAMFLCIWRTCHLK